MRYPRTVRIALFLLAFSPLLAQPLAIQGVNVIDVGTGSVRRGQTVVVSGTSIVAAGAEPTVAIPAGARRIDGAGHYLMPGLWDMHVHLRSSPVDADRRLVEDNAATLPLFLVHGVVGVREMGGDLSPEVLEWRAAAAAGSLAAPRILTAGRKLDVTKPAWPGSVATTSADEARDAVRQMKLAGSDFVKVYYSEVDREVLQAVIEESHRVGLKVTGHLPANLSLKEVAQMGIDGIEHAMYLRTPKADEFERFTKERKQRKKADLAMDATESLRRQIWLHNEEESKAVLAQLAARPFWLTPTLVVSSRVRVEIAEKEFGGDPRERYFFPDLWASWDVKGGRRRAPAASVVAVYKQSLKQDRELLKASHAAGVRILTGTDCGAANNYVMPGWSIHEELAALVDAGLTPAAALRTATVEAAAWRGEEKTEGAIAAGMRADMVLLRANPLTSIGATREIEAVVQGGKLLDRRRLDAMLSATADRAAKARAARQVTKQ